MHLLRKLLLPFVPVYYVVTWLRNKLYDVGVFNSTEYNFPVIAVGNLSVGGTGKTPMIEYLVRLLGEDRSLATLSRGYKRQTKGFLLANDETEVEDIGDEPFQFHSKFEDLLVCVDEDRRHGIAELLKLKSAPEIILLDDAFQHRKVKAGFYVLLTSYSKLYANDILLPTGDLREPRSGAKRADVIVVTKCPNNLDEVEKTEIIKQLNPKEDQEVFFSSIDYSSVLKGQKGEMSLDLLKGKPFSLVTGIANPKPLLEYLDSFQLGFKHLNFKDHHDFSESEIDMLKNEELIITTEKDYMRLSPHFKNQDNLFYLPIEVQLDKPELFNSKVNTFVTQF
ncbi:tetraacyldisaccharide 4'-kinase [Mangrovimonas sp. DI 80]|uniref:tetraacyldisaccharide 4'-kinase n=1 Tax=Mangrovimonas sp. DI 80 TaxID=1779330 RepID=UPI000976625B|nr:tetraacyldisaccharide 4'-kinase [Mangrovimonas sp. DI 80]OMP31704.1 tetraacyldisaccharide 4'-kinase [Mangrovimonas sp. DI 80]